jgi:hypothetical protein
MKGVIVLLCANLTMQGRTRIETMGIILFCALMTTVAIELIVSLPHMNISH